MRIDYVKSMIQDALWKAYKQTENDDYKRIYELWREEYENINIDILKP